ncbi:hypothetical protein, partial [Streptomyces sp. CBMA156]
MIINRIEGAVIPGSVIQTPESTTSSGAWGDVVNSITNVQVVGGAVIQAGVLLNTLNSVDPDCGDGGWSRAARAELAADLDLAAVNDAAAAAEGNAVAA